jgi:hypothetical protein
VAKVTSDYASLYLQYTADPFTAVKTIYSEWLTEGSRPKQTPRTDRECEAVVYALLKILLRKREFGKAATMLWGPAKFSSDPHLVKLLWSKLDSCNVLWVLGAGSCGKTWNAAIWHLLDWLADPDFTSVKVLSATEKHTKTNIFASLRDLHASALIKLPGDFKTESIRTTSNEAQGFEVVTVPPGPEGRGRLRGFHPKPRPEPHPDFGKLTRIRILLDEAETLPPGVFEEIQNILLTEEANSPVVKCTGLTNPKDMSSPFGQLCRPADPLGWKSIDEDSEVWEGQNGATVLSLDGAKSENVIEKRLVYPGFLTYEGYCRYDPQTPGFQTFCRGKFPTGDLNISVISQDVMNRGFSTLRWAGITIGLAAVDLAGEGVDSVILAYGRLGLAKGFGVAGDPNGDTLFEAPRKCLELVKLLEISKVDPNRKLETTQFIAAEVIRICKELDLTDRQLVVDKTGVGLGVYDMLRNVDNGLGSAVLGINYSESATESKILAEDSQRPSELYDRIATEMLFAVKKWLQFDYLKLAPKFNDPDLINELTSRRYHQKGLKLKLEEKKEYKSRGNSSPDRADAVSLLVHLARMRSEELQMIWSMNENSPNNRVEPNPEKYADSYIDFNAESDITERDHPMDAYHADYETDF